MDLHSYKPIDDLNLVNNDAAIEKSSQDLGISKYVHATASNEMKTDSLEVDLMYEELENRERDDNYGLQKMLEKEKNERALHDALQNKNASQFTLDVEKEKMALEEALNNEKSSTAALEKSLAKEKSVNADLEKKLNQKREDNAVLHKSLRKKKDTISILEAKLAEEQSHFAKFHQKVKVQLCSDKEAMKQLKKNLEQSEQKLKEKSETYYQQTQEKESKIQQLQDCIIKLQERALNQNSCNIQVQKLEQEITAKNQSLISLNTKVNQMSTDLAEEKNKNLSLQVNITAVQSQLQKAEREITNLTHKNMERFKENQETKLSYASEKTAVTQLQERLENETKNKTALMAHVQSLVDVIKSKDELLCFVVQITLPLSLKCPSSCGKCGETSTLHEIEIFTPGLKVHRDARQDTVSHSNSQESR
ncbi:hypothetical protein PAMA_016961 [Pampus argenteus]